MVARSVNQRPSMDQLQRHVKDVVGMNDQRPFLALCAHISGSEDADAAREDGLPWDQALLKSLMFAAGPNQSLTDIVRQKAEKGLPADRQTGSLMWSLLQVYAGCRDADENLKRFAVELTPNCSQRDYRLRWLVQLVMILALKLKESQASGPEGSGIYGKKARIEEAYFVHTSSQYVRQLLAADDWRSALLVALLIPSQPSRFGEIRSKLIYEALNLSATKLIVLGKQEGGYITQRLSLPQEWL